MTGPGRTILEPQQPPRELWFLLIDKESSEQSDLCLRAVELIPGKDTDFHDQMESLWYVILNLMIWLTPTFPCRVSSTKDTPIFAHCSFNYHRLSGTSRHSSTCWMTESNYYSFQILKCNTCLIILSQKEMESTLYLYLFKLIICRSCITIRYFISVREINFAVIIYSKTLFVKIILPASQVQILPDFSL